MAFYEFEQSEDAVRQLLEDLSFLQNPDTSAILNDSSLTDAIFSSLASIGQLPANGAPVVLHARAGNHHIKFNKALWMTIVTGLTSALGLLDPSNLGSTAVAGQILNYLASLRSILSSLDDYEGKVYRAILQIESARARSLIIFEVKEVSKEEILSVLDEQGELHPSAESIDYVLQSLLAKGALRTTFHQSAKPYFSTVF